MRLFLQGLFWFILPSTAVAGWMNTLEKDDFGDGTTAIAMEVRDGRGFGFRCETGKVPVVLYATREQWTDELGLFPAKLLVRLDDGEVQEFQAALEAYDASNAFRNSLRVRAMSGGDHLFGLMKGIAEAKKRIAVAIELQGEKYEKSRFSPVGSRRALKSIIEHCGSRMGDYERPKF